MWCSVLSMQTSFSGHKGSALAIAAEYKRRKQAGEISPREAARATRITKRINAPEYRPLKHRKPEVLSIMWYDVDRNECMYVYLFQEKSEENERELDKKIDSIKKRNKALEKRHKEIERDKQLYGWGEQINHTFLLHCAFVSCFPIGNNQL